jgi:hypothetical protein
MEPVLDENSNWIMEGFQPSKSSTNFRKAPAAAQLIIAQL